MTTKKKLHNNFLNNGKTPQPNKTNRCVAFVAGRSGGHIIPALTLAQQHKKKNAHDTILFFTTNTALDHKLLNTNNTVDKTVFLPLGNIPTKSKWYQWPLYFVNLIFTAGKTLYHLLVHRPKKIITTGGYICVPVCLLGRALRIPVIIYELNATAGKATQFLSSYAQEIVYCFPSKPPGLPKTKSKHAPYPIRFEKNQIAQNQISFAHNKKTILILGGSQGSHWINTLMQKIFNDNQWLQDSVQVIHQTGIADVKNMRQFYKNKNITGHVFSYQNNMAPLYQKADCVITRAGAGTLFEILHFSKKAIIIPLETHTTAHQIDNAFAMQKKYPKLFSVFKQRTIEKNENLFLNTLINHLTLDVSLKKCTSVSIKKESN